MSTAGLLVWVGSFTVNRYIKTKEVVILSLELENLSALSIGQLVNFKEVKPTEVVDYFADRIEKRNPSINAFVYTKIDEAMEVAKDQEKKIMSGMSPGVFAGVPVCLKDFLPSKKGWTNSHGGVQALIQKDTEDSEFTKAAEAMGAIPIGKTNAPAFAFRGITDNQLYGPTSTPFKPGYNSGGSSGGTAAAVGDGLVPLGEGSDGGGSIRIPSAWCGCFGFKPSVGAVPSVCRPDAWTATHPFCFNGAITRTVEDSLAIFQMMCHYDPHDPFSVPSSVIFNKNSSFVAKQTIRIGLVIDFGVFPVEDEIWEVIRRAAKMAESSLSANIIVEEVDPDSLSLAPFTAEDLAEMWCRMISIDTSIDMNLWARSGKVDMRDPALAYQLTPEFLHWDKVASTQTGIMDYRTFNEMRTAVLDMHIDLFKKYDFIISPVTCCNPVPNDTSEKITAGPATINGRKVDQAIGFCETFLQNFIGYPAASIPAGLSSDGLPIGMQIVGKKYSDHKLFQLSRIYENVNPWSYSIPFNRAI